MKSFLSHLALLLVGLVVGALLGFCFGSKRCPSPCEVISEQTDSTTVADTSLFVAPEPLEKEKTDTVYIKIPYPVADGDKEEQKDSVSSPPVKDSTATKPDSLVVPLERERKVYQDSTYKAVVSGIEPSLDYIETYGHTVFVTTTKVVRESESRWALSLNGGYGVSPSGLTPYLGIGVSYRLWSPKIRRSPP